MDIHEGSEALAKGLVKDGVPPEGLKKIIELLKKAVEKNGG